MLRKLLPEADMLRTRAVRRGWKVHMQPRLDGRQLLHLCEEPVRADDVRRGVLSDPHMRRARAMHGARRVLMPGRVVGRPLLDMR